VSTRGRRAEAAALDGALTALTGTLRLELLLLLLDLGPLTAAEAHARLGGTLRSVEVAVSRAHRQGLLGCDPPVRDGTPGRKPRRYRVADWPARALTFLRQQLASGG
jgi:hypothetical protein